MTDGLNSTENISCIILLKAPCWAWKSYCLKGLLVLVTHLPLDYSILCLLSLLKTWTDFIFSAKNVCKAQCLFKELSLDFLGSRKFQIAIYSPTVIPAFPTGTFKIRDTIFETFKVNNNNNNNKTPPQKITTQIDYPVSSGSFQVDQWFEENIHPHLPQQVHSLTYRLFNVDSPNGP